MEKTAISSVGRPPPLLLLLPVIKRKYISGSSNEKESKREMRQPSPLKEVSEYFNSRRQLSSAPRAPLIDPGVNQLMGSPIDWGSVTVS